MVGIVTNFGVTAHESAQGEEDGGRIGHRPAVGLVRAEAEAMGPEAEAMGLGWICERELREGA